MHGPKLSPSPSDQQLMPNVKCLRFTIENIFARDMNWDTHHAHTTVVKLSPAWGAYRRFDSASPALRARYTFSWSISHSSSSRGGSTYSNRGEEERETRTLWRMIGDISSWSWNDHILRGRRMSSSDLDMHWLSCQGLVTQASWLRSRDHRVHSWLSTFLYSRLFIHP